MCGICSAVNTTVPHNLHLAEPIDVAPMGGRL